MKLKTYLQENLWIEYIDTVLVRREKFTVTTRQTADESSLCLEQL